MRAVSLQDRAGLPPDRLESLQAAVASQVEIPPARRVQMLFSPALSNARVQLRGGRVDRLEEPVLLIPNAERET